MRALLVWGIVLAALCLLGFLPVGADVRYDDAGLRLGIRLGPFSLTLGKRKPAEETEKRPEKEKTEKEKTGKKKPGGRRLGLTPGLVLCLLRRAVRLLARLIAALRVEVLRAHFTAAFDDPAATALVYGAVGTAMEGLSRLSRGRVRLTDLRADADFDAAPVIDLRVLARLSLGRLLTSVLAFAGGALKDFLREHAAGRRAERAAARQGRKAA